MSTTFFRVQTLQGESLNTTNGNDSDQDSTIEPSENGIRELVSIKKSEPRTKHQDFLPPGIPIVVTILGSESSDLQIQDFYFAKVPQPIFYIGAKLKIPSHTLNQ